MLHLVEVPQYFLFGVKIARAVGLQSGHVIRCITSGISGLPGLAAPTAAAQASAGAHQAAESSFSCIVESLQYSPTGSHLAAGGQDGSIAVYDARLGFKLGLLVRCMGNSTPVRHMDWSRDGRVIRSNSLAREILHFDSHTGKRVTSMMADEEWETWTCVLGFQVRASVAFSVVLRMLQAFITASHDQCLCCWQAMQKHDNSIDLHL